jgi:murein endopeptidase
MFVVHDISQCGGGHISPHGSHRVGLDVDLGFRANHIPSLCNSGQRIATGEGAHRKTSDYESLWRPRYEELIRIIVANPYLKVKKIWYQDSALEEIFRHPNGVRLVSTAEKGHDRHMHVRFCMPDHYKSSIALGKVYSSVPKPHPYICG